MPSGSMLSAIAAVGLALAAVATAAVARANYSNQAEGFALTIPDGWVVVAHSVPNKPKVFIARTREEAGNRGCAVSTFDVPFAGNPTQAQIDARWTEALARDFMADNLDGAPAGPIAAEVVDIDGRRAGLVEVTVTLDGQTLVLRRLMLITPTGGYHLNCMDTPQRIDAMRPTFRAMEQSFRLTR